MTVKSIEDIEIKQKVQQVVEFTKCSEDKAFSALYDCDNDVEIAVDLIIEESTKFDEWQVKDKGKPKKTTPTNPTPPVTKPDRQSKFKKEKPQGKGSNARPKPEEKKPRKAQHKPSTGPSQKQETFVPETENSPSKVDSNKWEGGSDYDEWNGEAIEVLNSNSQIALETCEEPKAVEKEAAKVSPQTVQKTEDQKYQDIFGCKPQSKAPPRAVRFPLTKPVIFSPDLLSEYPSKNVTVVFGDSIGRQKADPKVVPSLSMKKNETFQSVKPTQTVINSNQRMPNEVVSMTRNSLNDLNQLKALNAGDSVRPTGNFQQSQFRNFSQGLDTNAFVDVDKLAILNIVDSAVVIQPTVSSACSPGNLNQMITSSNNPVLVGQQNNLRRGASNPTSAYNQNNQQQLSQKSNQQQNQFNKYQVNMPPGISQSNMMNDHHNGALSGHQLLNSQVIHQLNNNNRNQSQVQVMNNEPVYSKTQQNSIYYYDQGQGQNQSSYQGNLSSGTANSSGSRGMPSSNTNNGVYDMNDLKISSTKSSDNSHLVTMVHPATQHQPGQGQSHHGIHGHLVESPAPYYPLMFMTPTMGNNPMFQQHGGPPHHSNNSAAPPPPNQTNDMGNLGSTVTSKHQSSSQQQSMFNQNSQYHHPHHPHHQAQQQIVTAHAVAAHHQMQDLHHHKGFGNEYKTSGGSSSFDKQAAFMQQGNAGQSQNYHLIIPGGNNGPNKQNKSHRN